MSPNAIWAVKSAENELMPLKDCAIFLSENADGKGSESLQKEELQMLSVISIVLAIGLPAFALWKNGKEPIQRPYLFSVASFAFCGITAIAELFTIKKWIVAGKIGSVEDTIGAVIALCIGLLVFTVILNLMLLGMSCEKE